MADNTMGDDELYGSSKPMGGEMDGEKAEGAEGEASESVDREEAEGAENSAVVSNKILSPDGEPLKEGDEVVLQVVKNYGDESEVKYAPKKPETPAGEEAGPADYESDLTAMSEKG